RRRVFEPARFWNSLLTLADHVFQQIDTTIRIAPFVVVPANQLEETIVEFNSGAGVEYTRIRIVDEVRRHHFVFRIGQNAFQVRFAGLFHGGTDVLVAGFLDGANGQVNHRNRGRGHAKGHAGELALDLGNGQADRLGRPGGRGNDVDAGGPASLPVLA